MKLETDNEHFDPRMQRAIEEIRGVIEQHYPGARFEITRGHDEPVNVHLVTTVDLDDPDEVSDLVDDRLVELQVEERIPLYVIPVRTPERILASLKAERRPERTVRRIISAKLAR
ncbi:MAG: hypothetical protein GEU73_17030 [Chloroflexi bacterium]|nr:hypothetical protein [Chloroflexota bacterium]